jgi:hypothetical protein
MTDRLTKDDTYRICVALQEYAWHLIADAESTSTNYSDTMRQSMHDTAKTTVETLRKMVPRLAKTDIRYFVNYLD